MSDDCFTWLIKIIGTLILFVPVSIGFAFAWFGIALVGIIIFVFFTIAALCLDPVRWVGNNFRKAEETPVNQQTIHRLRKAAMIIILIFEIMAELKHGDLRKALLPEADVDRGGGDVEAGTVPRAQVARA